MLFTKHLTKKLASLNQLRKLHLVLDLDHTLVHSIHISEFSQKEKYLIEEADSRLDLWRLNVSDSGDFFIKLRPFAREFLQEANKLFSMSVYTMATSDYAHAVLSLIDPEKVYFGDRVITREDSPYKKTLDLVKGTDKRRVVIVDDTRDVWWPQHKRNLLEISKYVYFRADMDNNKSRELSYAEKKIDESCSNGSLANVLKFLKTVHKRFQQDLDLKDLRLLLSGHCRRCCF